MSKQQIDMGEVWQKIVRAEDARVSGQPVEKPAFAPAHAPISEEVRARLEKALDGQRPVLN